MTKYTLADFNEALEFYEYLGGRISEEDVVACEARLIEMAARFGVEYTRPSEEHDFRLCMTARSDFKGNTHSRCDRHDIISIAPTNIQSYMRTFVDEIITRVRDELLPHPGPDFDKQRFYEAIENHPFATLRYECGDNLVIKVCQSLQIVAVDVLYRRFDYCYRILKVYFLPKDRSLRGGMYHLSEAEWVNISKHISMFEQNVGVILIGENGQFVADGPWVDLANSVLAQWEDEIEVQKAKVTANERHSDMRNQYTHFMALEKLRDDLTPRIDPLEEKPEVGGKMEKFLESFSRQSELS